MSNEIETFQTCFANYMTELRSRKNTYPTIVTSCDHNFSSHLNCFPFINLSLLISFHIQRSAFPGSSVDEEPACNAGDTRDTGSIPGSGRSPEEGHGKPLQYSCLENFMDRGAWWATVHGVTKSWTQQSTHPQGRNGYFVS